MSRIFLLITDPLLAGRMRMVLNAAPNLVVAGWATTLAQAVDTLPDIKPDLVIADLELADGPFTGFLTELSHSSAYGRPQTMVVAQAIDEPGLMEALHQGTDGYFIASRSSRQLVITVEQVLAGGSPMAAEIAREVQAHFEALSWDQSDYVSKAQNPLQPTDEERKLLQLLASGMSVEHIAHALHVTEHAIGLNIRKIYRKLRFDTRAGTLTLQLL
jgi:DNA-binding NarL/FixJ family response regulator